MIKFFYITSIDVNKYIFMFILSLYIYIYIYILNIRLSNYQQYSEDYH